MWWGLYKAPNFLPREGVPRFQPTVREVMSGTGRALGKFPECLSAPTTGLPCAGSWR